MQGLVVIVLAGRDIVIKFTRDRPPFHMHDAQGAVTGGDVLDDQPDPRAGPSAFRRVFSLRTILL